VTVTTLELWGILLAISAGTFLLRFSFIHWLGDRRISPGWETALQLVPTAVLCAIVVPAVLFDAGAPAVSLGNPRLLAGALAALVALRTRNILLTIVVGMAALWGLQAWMG
jgi:branched-subunit amino acid transport protein